MDMHTTTYACMRTPTEKKIYTDTLLEAANWLEHKLIFGFADGTPVHILL